MSMDVNDRCLFHKNWAHLCRLIYYPPYKDDFKYRQLIDHAVGRWGDYLTSIPNYYLDYHL